MATVTQTQDHILSADEYYGDDFVNDQVAKYKGRHQNHWGERMESVLRMVDEAVPKGSKVLDLACGVGAFTISAAKRGYDVVGLDYSDAALEAARKLSKEEGVEVPFVKGDATALPFEDGTFDVIIASDIIEHLFDPPLSRMLHECFRVLKKGGALVIHTTPTRYLYLLSPIRALPLVPFAWLPQDKLDRVIELYEKYPFTAAYRRWVGGGKSWLESTATRGHCNCPEFEHLGNLIEGAGFKLELYKAEDTADDLAKSRSYRVLARVFKNSRHFRGHIRGICRKP